ncbi:M48 family metallopeptidase [Oscillochloris sp. ZM17-4]|uniref:tetratricopeptide repeat protein n=1 Tax=Oscillochloris sp. ZM17-4 TaxID=2866714 RepID=UPI002105C6DE|nr:hypothetical protein [Oscillochloris sp. ZM17-4]
MQLGIEAARDGNKEEARNLFRLLTLQDPANGQAWLWLAGVAETREERQAALERVVELDPKNEMAIKGLQALGARAESPSPDIVPATSPPLSVNDDPFGDDDDDPFASLNDLSDIMADAEKPIRRADPPPTDETDELAAIGVGSSSDSSASRPSSGSASRPSSGSTSRPSSGSTSSRRSIYDEEEDTVPARRGMSPLLSILLGLVALLLIGLLFVFFFFNSSGQSVADQAAQQTAAADQAAQQTAAAAAAEEPTAILGEGADQGAGPTEAITSTTTLEEPTAEATVEPTAPAPADVSQANPVIVSASTPLQSEGWIYDFNQPTYAAPIIGPLGQYQPANGRFVVVLVFAVNSTGTSQTIPPDFFVLKDAQGRVWSTRPEVSDAYVIPGVNADLSQTQQLPPDGLTRSVALIFDVAPDATNLVFFARSNPTQGWLVLPNV